MAGPARGEPPAPDPDMVTASRRHLTTRYADGVERLFWELEKRPMPDLAAVGAVVGAHEAGQVVDALGVGAALVLVQSLRLELDALEGGVFAAAIAGGLSYESLAAVLELPDADAARDRGEYLRRRQALPKAAPSVPQAGETGRSGEAGEAAVQAARRADRAASRATAAARRRAELREDGPHRHRAATETAAARASEAKAHASETAERVALGLLRAASALDQCAARYEQWQDTSGDSKFRQLAEEYASAARRYREIAARYRDIGGGPPTGAGPPPSG